MGPDLTQGEIDAICEPLKQPAAQVRYLERLGLVVARKPNGRPLVNRTVAERAVLQDGQTVILVRQRPLVSVTKITSVS